MGASGVGAAGMAGISLYQGYVQSEAIKSEAKFSAQLARQNAELAEAKAADAVVRGDKQASNLQLEVSQLLGTQRSGYAAQGVIVDSGSAAEVSDASRRSLQEDVNTIKSNAWKEAWGFKMDAQNIGFEAELNTRAAKNKARNTLITSGLQAANFAMQGVSKGGATSGKTTSSGFGSSGAGGSSFGGYSGVSGYAKS